MSNTFCKCGTTIPQPRVDMGYTTCVECSTARKYGATMELSHKALGNAVVIQNPDDAIRINKRMRRVGYGILRGMKY